MTPEGVNDRAEETRGGRKYERAGETTREGLTTAEMQTAT
jgi:hypothetical protein